MKYCCDRCEKPIEINILGDTICATFITIKSFFPRDIILCSECEKKLNRFLDNKESEEE